MEFLLHEICYLLWSGQIQAQLFVQFIYELGVELDRVKWVGDLADKLIDEADHLLVPKADYVLDIVKFQRITRLYQDHPYSLADELPDPSKLNNLVEAVKL